MNIIYVYEFQVIFRRLISIEFPSYVCVWRHRKKDIYQNNGRVLPVFHYINASPTQHAAHEMRDNAIRWCLCTAEAPKPIPAHPMPGIVTYVHLALEISIASALYRVMASFNSMLWLGSYQSPEHKIMLVLWCVFS